jgi:anti-sigma B factor antagonist
MVSVRETHTLGESGDLCGARLSASSPCPRVLLIEVMGELDMRSAPEVAQFLAPRVAARPAHLVLDLSCVTFLTCAGMTVLVHVLQNASAAGVALHVTGAIGNPVVEPLLELAREVTVFDVHPSSATILGTLSNGSANECDPQ